MLGGSYLGSSADTASAHGLNPILTLPLIHSPSFHLLPLMPAGSGFFIMPKEKERTHQHCDFSAAFRVISKQSALEKGKIPHEFP